MLVVIAVVGVLVLGGLAVWVGHIEGRALDGAWRRLATARQGFHERMSDLDEREFELDERERAADHREEFLEWWERRLREERDN